MNIINKNTKGFSLVEVLVAVGILGIISTGAAGLMIASVQNSNRTEGTVNLSTFIQTLATYAYNETTCTSMLPNNISINYTSIDSKLKVPFSFNMPETGTIAANEKISSFGLEVKKFELRDLSPVAYDAVTNNSYAVGKLYLTTSIMKEATGGQDLRERPIGALNLKMNSSGTVVACAATPLFTSNNPSNNNYYNGQNPNITMPDGTPMQKPSGACDAVCVIQDWFKRNTTGDTAAKAQAWMNSVGVDAYTGYANAYAMNQTLGPGGVANNALATGNAMGYSQNAVDSWTQSTVASYSSYSPNTGAALYQNTVSGYNTAAAMYSPSTVQSFVSQYGTTNTNAAALVINSAASSNYTASQTSNILSQAASKYSAAEVSAYFASGGTVASAIAAGYIKKP